MVQYVSSTIVQRQGTFVLDNIRTIVQIGGMTKTLLEETLELLRTSNVPLASICENTGVKLRWLHRLLDGDFTEPGVNKIERLHDYLAGNVSPESKRQRRRA